LFLIIAVAFIIIVFSHNSNMDTIKPNNSS
jgi:hypothetical protein